MCVGRARADLRPDADRRPGIVSGYHLSAGSFPDGAAAVAANACRRTPTALGERAAVVLRCMRVTVSDTRV